MIKTKLKPYIGYDAIAGMKECAILIFARSAQEAKPLAFDTLNEFVDSEYCNVRVNLISDKEDAHWAMTTQARQEYLRDNISHVIESPDACRDCGQWCGHLDSQRHCEECSARYITDRSEHMLYELGERSVCQTECPYKAMKEKRGGLEPIMIASVFCINNCDDFEGIDREKQIVGCLYLKKQGEKK